MVEAVPIPPRMARLRLDPRGYPIFWTCFVDPNGVPDFRVLELDRVMLAIEKRLCGMCGQPIVGNTLCFVTSEHNLETLRRATDPPMHEDCARYALAVCPFLSGRSKRRSGKAVPVAGEDQAFDRFGRWETARDRPERAALVFTNSYNPRWDKSIGGFVFQKPFRVEWLDDG